MGEGTDCRVTCPTHGLVYLSEEQYQEQLNNVDAPWHCPLCKETAEFDDDFLFAAQGILPGDDEDEFEEDDDDDDDTDEDDE
jgi:hypothetical protein